MLEFDDGMTGRGYRWEEKRIAILQVNPQILGNLLIESATYKVTTGLPEDARCISASIDPYNFDLLLCIESECFEPVKEGAQAPNLPATMIEIVEIEGE